MGSRCGPQRDGKLSGGCQSRQPPWRDGLLSVPALSQLPLPSIDSTLPSTLPACRVTNHHPDHFFFSAAHFRAERPWRPQ
jgi:hypothetical protein